MPDVLTIVFPDHAPTCDQVNGPSPDALREHIMRCEECMDGDSLCELGQLLVEPRCSCGFEQREMVPLIARLTPSAN